MEKQPVILYVEDNPENRLLVRRIMEAEGCTVVEADTARQAFEKVNRLIPDLILMDINMPDLDGYTITAQLKSLPALQNVPIVALTANVMKGDRERTLKAGCDGYIQKPIDVDSLPAQIKQFMQKR